MTEEGKLRRAGRAAHGFGRTFVLLATAKLLAIALTCGVLYSLVLLERFALNALPTEAVRVYRESAFVAPVIGVTLTMGALLGLVYAFEAIERVIRTRFG